MPKYVNKFLVWHKKFGPTQNILGPVKGQVLVYNFYFQVRIGAFDDAHDRMGKYWYWFGLKKYMTYIWAYTTSASKITWNVSSKLQCGTQVSTDFGF